MYGSCQRPTLVTPLTLPATGNIPNKLRESLLLLNHRPALYVIIQEAVTRNTCCIFRFCRTVNKNCLVICGNKKPTRCNRGFYCRSYCLLNMFRAPLCPTSGAQEYYTVLAACGISCCGFQVAGLVWS